MIGRPWPTPVLLPFLSGIPMRIVIGIAVVGLVAGCNSGSSPKAPAPQTPPAAPQVAEVDVAPQAPAAGQKKAKAEVAKAKKPRPSEDPGVNPLDVFEPVPGEQKFEMVVAEGKPVSGDDFTGILPPKGIDSTRFDAPDLPKPPPVPKKTVAAPSTSAQPPADSESSDRKTRSGRKTAAHKRPERKTADRKSADRKKTSRKTEETPAEPRVAVGNGKTLPAGFSPLTAAKDPSLGWPLRIRSDRDGAEMALVSGGAVIVGRDGGPRESSPQISVVLDSFYMDVNEVTLKQYAKYRKYLIEDRGRDNVPDAKNFKSPPNFPALGVTLNQAEFYAKWAGKELPTEAEWERAARGPAGFAHPWGNGRAIWTHARTPEEIDAVRTFRTDVSPYGIYDLAGNAREWCTDRYSPTAFAAALKSASGGELRNWKGPRLSETEDAHVVKGNGPNWDAWYRMGLDGTHPHNNVGFRCILRLPEKPAE
jgi:formylglycine-generating enzyme required for sulfatase activity